MIASLNHAILLSSKSIMRVHRGVPRACLEPCCRRSAAGAPALSRASRELRRRRWRSSRNQGSTRHSSNRTLCRTGGRVGTATWLLAATIATATGFVVVRASRRRAKRKLTNRAGRCRKENGQKHESTKPRIRFRAFARLLDYQMLSRTGTGNSTARSA
jgi:hypothetical protein